MYLLDDYETSDFVSIDKRSFLRKRLSWTQKHKNTKKYVNIERKIFADYGNDEFNVKVAGKPEEATKYLEVGYEWVGVKDNLIFLRKRK